MVTYSELFFFLLLLLPVLLVLGNSKKKERLKLKLPAGPPGLPLIGNFHHLGKQPHHTLWKLSKTYGPLMHLQIGHVPLVVVSSAQMAKEVMKIHDLIFCSRPKLISWKRLTYNFKDVGFSPYGATWRELKKIVVLNLLSSKNVERFRSVREEEVERLISLIGYLSYLSEPINLSKLLHALSNDITCRVAFGKRFYSEGQGSQENMFHRILKNTEALLVEFFVADYFPWAWWVDILLGRHPQLEKNFAELEAFYQKVIEAHVNRMGPLEQEDDFIDVLLRLQKEETHLTDEHVKGLLMNVLLGGTDTSSAILEYAMAEIMRNPSILLKAQKEVRDVVGEKGKVEESDISHLTYLKSVVKETLRLHPVAPLLAPRETTGHVNINGYDILPKMRVIVNVWAIGREPTSWDNPDDFIPDRFLNSIIDFKGNDFQFIPFGAGRRICPGMNFGITIVELALANLLYAFNWDLTERMAREGINMEEEADIVVHLKNALHLKATKYLHSG